MSQVSFSSRNSNESGTVIPFRSLDNVSSNSNDVNTGSAELDNIPDDKLKALIDAAVMKTYLAEKSQHLSEHDGPFDPIYIAALQMDSIQDADFQAVIKYQDIHDLSDQIRFEDGLDD